VVLYVIRGMGNTLACREDDCDVKQSSVRRIHAKNIYGVYTTHVLTVSDEQRRYLDLDGAPLPLIDAERVRGYMLMPVNFTPRPGGRVMARVPGIRAVGEADQATDALATLAVLIKEVLERL
jgi:hypothetical protein